MVDLTNLKKLTRELESFVDETPNIRYKVKGGECFGFNLYHIPGIAVQRAFISKGGIFEEHIHKDEVEIIVIYQGKLEGVVDGNNEILEIGDCIRADKCILHSWKAIEDTWMIGITIPASGAYPDG